MYYKWRGTAKDGWIVSDSPAFIHNVDVMKGLKLASKLALGLVGM